MIFGNGTDGLWGVQLDLPCFPWLRKVVTEYLITRNQSGPFHFIIFDHDKYQGPGGPVAYGFLSSQIHAHE